MAPGCAVGIPGPVTYRSDSGASLNGGLFSTVEGETTYRFRYGKTAAYGSASAPVALSITNDAAHPMSVPLAGLAPGTTYHWQLCTADGEEEPPREVCSADQAFTTRAAGGRSGLAFSSERDGNAEIYVMNADGSAPTRLTTSAAEDTEPSWSPDGGRIAFSSDRGGNPDLYAMNADGTAVTRLTNTASSETEPAWSPAGDRLMFTRDDTVVSMALDGGDERVLAESGSFKFFAGAWAPDAIGYAHSIDYGGALAELARDAGGGGLLPSTCARGDWHPSGRRLALGCDPSRTGKSIHVGGTSEDGFGMGVDPLGPGDEPSWSPDGTALAFVRDGDVWTMSAAGTGALNRTSTPAAESAPDWSPRP